MQNSLRLSVPHASSEWSVARELSAMNGRSSSVAVKHVISLILIAARANYRAHHFAEVKISDFGLSRLGVHYKLKTAMKLPIKWLAPETITTFTFSLKTDVFSYGVMVYEIFADGAEPWDGQTNAEVKLAVCEGKCLTFPKCTPDKVRKFFVERVFVKNPASRATMTEKHNEHYEFPQQLSQFFAFSHFAKIWLRRGSDPGHVEYEIDISFTTTLKKL
ncbi:hypothetical protein Y032_0990g3305 [Ancylostoma ceylanicum]|nr:hypothetical protein Y032_0990g3305 [Ancylostoma ceylanicum]